MSNFIGVPNFVALLSEMSMQWQVSLNWSNVYFALNSTFRNGKYFFFLQKVTVINIVKIFLAKYISLVSKHELQLLLLI